MCRPRGKPSQRTLPLAIVTELWQVLEETGYNLAGQIDPDDVIEVSIREQQVTLFIVPDVPEDYPFETKTRKEISVRYV
jgi:mRNA-decapping enzyme subunit 2